MYGGSSEHEGVRKHMEREDTDQKSMRGTEAQKAR